MRWLPPAEWEKLKQGIDCPMCGDIHLDENPFSFLVAELRQRLVRLPKNQYLKGWTIIALKRHANEMFELSDQELLGFWQDVAQVARALDQLHSPAKINYGVFGSRCPHLHCHLIVRSYADDPTEPLDMLKEEVLLSK